MSRIAKHIICTRCLAALVIVLMIIFYTFIPTSVNYPTWSTNWTESIAGEGNRPHSPKLILYWTDYFEFVNFSVGLGQSPFVDGNCSVRNCQTTRDRSLFNESHAVIFHSRNLKLTDLPTYRLPHQRFIYFNYEAPPNSGLVKTTKLNNFFNWTMTYRLDSDIISREPYGVMKSADRPATETINLSGKNRTVAWFVSHCQTNSRREWFVTELSKYIDVDIYGNCGQQECDQNDQCKRATYDLLRSKYRFYLSFENSLCRDYVTEKLFRPMSYDVVPVVYGEANYSQFLPPHSYINIRDYQSPRQLADHLRQLMTDDAKYLAYFEWRHRYRIVQRPRDGWCGLCRLLNDGSLGPKTYEDVISWWMKQTCRQAPTIWGQPPKTVASFSSLDMIKIFTNLLSLSKMT